MELKCDKDIKITLTTLIIGVIISVIVSLFAKYFKGTL